MTPGPEVPHRFTRFIRVPTPGLLAQLDVVDGDLVNVSASGALVRTGSELPVGSEWHVLLDLGPSPIKVVGRVARCERASTEPQGETPSRKRMYVVGVKFIEPTRMAQNAIIGLCGGSQTVEEWPYRIVVLGENQELNDLVCAMLREHSYEATVVRDPETAVQTAKDIHADAILVSASLTSALLATRPATRPIPTVAFATADSVTPQQGQALEEGQVPLLTVPFTEGDLLTAAKLALRRP